MGERMSRVCASCSVFDGSDIPFSHGVVLLCCTVVHCDLQWCTDGIKGRFELIVATNVSNPISSIIALGKDIVHCIVDGQSFFIDQTFG